jgi:hypothetical protein
MNIYSKCCHTMTANLRFECECLSLGYSDCWKKLLLLNAGVRRENSYVLCMSYQMCDVSSPCFAPHILFVLHFSFYFLRSVPITVAAWSKA